MKRWVKWMLVGVAAATLVCLGGVVWLALSNRSLPKQSGVTETLTDTQKALLIEAQRLRRSLGDKVWQGWGEASIPIIVHNEAYAFLVGYPDDPPAGWVMAPRGERRGGAWEAMPGEGLSGQPYYRSPITDPGKTPENFTVRVGDEWAATLGTWEYAEVSFYAGYREQLPPGLREVFPYRMMFNLLMGTPERYIAALEHEAFHAWQGLQAPQRLAEAELAAPLEERYPWDDAQLEAAWKGEAELLVGALRAGTDAEAMELGRQFLAQREFRRKAAGLSPELVDYERQREWLEGLAKYAELEITRLAGVASDYTPAAEATALEGFTGYADRELTWSAQVDEIIRAAGRSSENRFYYTGFGQAALLDRLFPGWKEAAFAPGVMLEDLLRQALGGS